MGDRALLVELGDEISLEVNQRVRELFYVLDGTKLSGITELLPSYRSLLLIFDPLKISLAALKNRVMVLQKTLDPSLVPEPKTLRIPVAYGDEYGPDLEWVAEYHHITTHEVIRLHSSVTYHVFMIGFTPGYPYLGELPDEIVSPRRKTPRTHVPRGSVGIAQKQTGIYPVESPGGWQIIGRTPINLFDPQAWPPAFLAMGDLVTFDPISKEEYVAWQP
jgi:KipI family sensor histidine kinase inhibitor